MICGKFFIFRDKRQVGRGGDARSALSETGAREGSRGACRGDKRRDARRKSAIVREKGQRRYNLE
jgi:hypothetical protein